MDSTLAVRNDQQWEVGRSFFDFSSHKWLVDQRCWVVCAIECENDLSQVKLIYQRKLTNLVEKCKIVTAIA
jgi:hypothetical protein